jgi:hypothetical protein
VCGHIATAWDDPQSNALQDEFVRELFRGFARVKSYRVGPEAGRLLDDGVRLVTIDLKAPVEYDLRRRP